MIRFTLPRLAAAAGLVTGGFITIAFAQSNIDNTVPNRHAWAENVGWTNWRGEATPGQGVLVGPRVMSGFIWSENAGWINTGDGTPATPPYYANVDGSDFGVNISPDGTLHGFAWAENLGWVNFDGGAMATPPQPARILCASPPAQPLARLSGYAWAENAGWLNLSDLAPTRFVALDAGSTPRACDMNHDGRDNAADVQLFANHLLAGSGDWQDVCSGDVDTPGNGTIDVGDVDDFVTCLLTKP
jgi:hypothetical protein